MGGGGGGEGGRGAGGVAVIWSLLTISTDFCYVSELYFWCLEFYFKLTTNILYLVRQVYPNWHSISLILGL